MTRFPSLMNLPRAWLVGLALGRRPATEDLVEGLFVLLLALAVWRLTDNFWAWFFLFIPGSVMVGRGFLRTFRDWL